jgi:hypothetical protein
MAQFERNVENDPSTQAGIMTNVAPLLGAATGRILQQMATILTAVRAAESKARIVRRAAAISTGMASVLDMGAHLAVYRRALLGRLVPTTPKPSKDIRYVSTGPTGNRPARER